MNWINGKQYFNATFKELIYWILSGHNVFTVLDLDAYVDVGVPVKLLEYHP